MNEDNFAQVIGLLIAVLVPLSGAIAYIAKKLMDLFGNVVTMIGEKVDESVKTGKKNTEALTELTVQIKRSNDRMEDHVLDKEAHLTKKDRSWIDCKRKDGE